MKLTKENVYINLQGKSKEELTELWEFLSTIEEKQFVSLRQFLIYCEKWKYYTTESDNEWFFCTSLYISNKQEVTIEQLKKILQPMGTFTPIAMRCTQEQFETIKPKLVSCKIEDMYDFSDCNYLTNNYADKKNVITNVDEYGKDKNNRTVHETWNEEIFLKVCGIEVETLQEKAIRLENELNEVKQQIEEESKIKIGDWVKRTYGGIEMFKADNTHDYRYINSEKRVYQKITNPELIKLLEQENK